MAGGKSGSANLRTTSSVDSVFTWSVSYKQTILVSSVMSALSITSLLSMFLVSDVVTIAEAERGYAWSSRALVQGHAKGKAANLFINNQLCATLVAHILIKREGKTKLTKK